ncbi:MAG: cell wall hydrolase [bacterium JZ-2024 1]
MKHLLPLLFVVALWYVLSRPRKAKADVVEDNPFMAAVRRVAMRWGVSEEVAAIALTIAGEAAGEPRNGQIAVGWVIRNRVAKRYGVDYIDVVTAPRQFEPVHDCLSGRQQVCDRMERNVTGDIVLIAQGVYSGIYPDTSEGATHFYSPTTQAALGRPAPSWSRTMTLTTTIGNHKFYR